MFMKEWICTIAGLAGGFIAAIFGGWDSALVTLLIFMGADFLTGLSLLLWEKVRSLHPED